MTGYIVIREIVIHLAEAVFYDSKTNIAKFQFNLDSRVQRKLILQLALLEFKTFVLQYFCNFNSPKNLCLPIGQVKHRIH